MSRVNFIKKEIKKVKKYRRRRRQWKWWPVLLFILVVAGWSTLAMWNRPRPRADMEFGVTYSINYAEDFGLDYKQVYDAIIDDLKVPLIRLPIYWDQIEPLPDRFDWRKYDYMIDKAEASGTKLLVAIGRRLPRWPECHEPPWIKSQVEAFKQERILQMLEKIMLRYRVSEAISGWQVENEPFLSLFGECPKSDEGFLREEVALVRKLDPIRSITITESGELSTWARGASLGDELGVSMYRVTWNEIFGYWYYPLGPNFYKRKAQVISPLVNRTVISELQAEPWATDMYLDKIPINEQYRSMNPKRFRRNIDFARRTGFDQAYLWGAEWWYWLRDFHGDNSMWQAAQELWRN